MSDTMRNARISLCFYRFAIFPSFLFMNATISKNKTKNNDFVISFLNQKEFLNQKVTYLFIYLIRFITK